VVIYVFLLYSSMQSWASLGSQKSFWEIPKTNHIILMVFTWLHNTNGFVNWRHLHILHRVSVWQNFRSVRFLRATIGLFSINYSGTIQNCISSKMHQSASKGENNLLSTCNFCILQHRRDFAWYPRCNIQKFWNSMLKSISKYCRI